MLVAVHATPMLAAIGDGDAGDDRRALELPGDAAGEVEGRARPSRRPGEITTNSSPPRRPTRSPGRNAPRSRLATTSSTASPTAWPRESLMPLKSSRSMKSRPTPPVAPDVGERVLQRGDGAGAVEAPGQRVGAGPVLERLAQPRGLGDVGDAHHAAGDLAVVADARRGSSTRGAALLPSSPTWSTTSRDADAVAQERGERGGQLEVVELAADRLGRAPRGDRAARAARQPPVGVLDPSVGVELGHADRQRLGEQPDELALGDQRLGGGDLSGDVVQLDADLARAVRSRSRW